MDSPRESPRFEYIELPLDCHLAVLPTRKLKTVAVLVFVPSDLDDLVTRRALLPEVLKRGTQRHPSMQAIHRHLESLYGAELSAGVLKIGEWHTLRFRLEVVNDRFLPDREPLLREGLDFLCDFVRRPLEDDGAFVREFVEQEKHNQERAIASLVDNKAAYAEHRMLQTMCANEAFRLHSDGRVEDLAGIDARNLREFHAQTINRRPIYIYVAGDIRADDARRLVEESLLHSWRDRVGGGALSPPQLDVVVTAAREVEETMDVQQARLVMGFRHGVSYGDPRYPAMLVMNGVLGGFSHSKLFQNVREKANLAYSVHSSLERTKGLLLITAGVAREKRKQARAIILEQLEALRSGEVSDAELGATVATLLNHNEMLEDDSVSLCGVDFVWRLSGQRLDLAAWRQSIAGVRRDDVIEAARSLQLDTTYFLNAPNGDS